MKNESIWINSSKGDNYPKIDKDLKCQVLVIGGGITGITTAYLLAKEKIDVVLVEAGKIGEGTTGRSTGKITPQIGLCYEKIVSKYGLKKGRDYYNGAMEALKFVEETIKKHAIDCDYNRVPSYLFTENSENIKALMKEYKACKDIGIDCTLGENLQGPMDIKGYLKFEVGAQFNPKKYVDGLCKEIVSLGGRIFENSPIEEVQRGSCPRARTRNDKVIECDELAMCSHYPFFDDFSFYYTRLRPEKSYIVASEYTGVFPEGIFVNIEDPSRSLRTYGVNGKNYLLLCGEKHKVGEELDVDHYENLKNYGRSVFKLQGYSFQWSTEDYTTPDKIPYIGHINKREKNIYVGTGYSKWGMINGTLAGMMISDLMMYSKNNYEDTYNPSRKKGYLSLEFLKDNGVTAYNYLRGMIDMGDTSFPQKKGEGKIVRIDGKRMGVYMDDKGTFHVIKPKCTHLGCELQWNSIEKSWDCPCHGSRYDVDGNIIEGPTSTPLFSPQKN